jgi:hypothetical protein
MTNDPLKNPIRIDTLGNVTNERKRIVGISVLPSAGSWEAELFATGSSWGAKIFHAKGADASSYYEPINPPKPTLGIQAVTLTNITEVLVRTDESD